MRPRANSSPLGFPVSKLHRGVDFTGSDAQVANHRDRVRRNFRWPRQREVAAVGHVIDNGGGRRPRYRRTPRASRRKIESPNRLVTNSRCFGLVEHRHFWLSGEASKSKALCSLAAAANRTSTLNANLPSFRDGPRTSDPDLEIPVRLCAPRKDVSIRSFAGISAQDRPRQDRTARVQAFASAGRIASPATSCTALPPGSCRENRFPPFTASGAPRSILAGLAMTATPVQTASPRSAAGGGFSPMSVPIRTGSCHHQPFRALPPV